VNPPVTLSSTYVATAGTARPDDVIYGRHGNETWSAFESALGALEGGDALLFSSGLATVAAVVALVPAGGTVVVPRHAYNGTHDLLREEAATGRIGVRVVDVTDTGAVVAALDGADLLWVETPTNPVLEIADLPVLCREARARGVLVAVDNTFPTPLGLRPLTLGADLSVHSVTKYLAGHSDVVLGAAVTASAELRDRLHAHRTLRGAIPGPFEAWLALRGLRTLHVRLDRATANAVELARRLSTHPAVRRVRHPSLPADPGHALAASYLDGPGAVVAIEVAGGAEAAERVASAVRLWVHATSLGGVESSLERRRRVAAEPATVPADLIRLSVGIEDVEDLWQDLDTALRSSTGTGMPTGGTERGVAG